MTVRRRFREMQLPLWIRSIDIVSSRCVRHHTEHRETPDGHLAVALIVDVGAAASRWASQSSLLCDAILHGTNARYTRHALPLFSKEGPFSNRAFASAVNDCPSADLLVVLLASTERDQEHALLGTLSNNSLGNLTCTSSLPRTCLSCASARIANGNSVDTGCGLHFARRRKSLFFLFGTDAVLDVSQRHIDCSDCFVVVTEHMSSIELLAALKLSLSSPPSRRKSVERCVLFEGDDVVLQRALRCTDDEMELTLLRSPRTGCYGPLPSCRPSLTAEGVRAWCMHEEQRMARMLLDDRRALECRAVFVLALKIATRAATALHTLYRPAFLSILCPAFAERLKALVHAAVDAGLLFYYTTRQNNFLGEVQLFACHVPEQQTDLLLRDSAWCSKPELAEAQTL